jgi:hypothetical protein
MSKQSTGNGSSFVKTPYTKTVFNTDQELQDFIKCCDPDTGYLHFMDNFFYIQHPTKGSMVYHPWEYQKRLIHTYHNYRFSISLMPRQSGKCLSGNSVINIRNNITGIEYELPIQVFHEFNRAKQTGEPLPDISEFEVKAV